MGLLNGILKGNKKSPSKQKGLASSGSFGGESLSKVSQDRYVETLYTNPRLHPVLKMVTDFEAAKFGIYDSINGRKGDLFTRPHPFYKQIKQTDPMTGVTGRKALGVCMANYLMVGESILWLRDDKYFVGIPKSDIVERPTDLGIEGHYKISVRGVNIPLDKGKDKFVVFKNPHPNDPTKSVGRMNAIAEEVGLAGDMLIYERTSINSGGQPNQIYALEGADQDIVDNFTAVLRQNTMGKHNARQPLVFNKKVDVSNVSNSNMELDYVNSKRANADMIEEFVGMPPEMFGKLKNSNKATALVSGQIYGREVKEPLYKYFAELMTEEFVQTKPAYNNLELFYDGLIPTDEELAMTYYKEGLINGGVTRNEYREQLAKSTQSAVEPLPDEAGLHLIQPLNTMIVDSQTGEYSNPNGEKEEQPIKFVKPKKKVSKEADKDMTLEDLKGSKIIKISPKEIPKEGG